MKHSYREFHLARRAELHFEHRRWFRAAMAAVRSGESSEKVVHHKQTRAIGGQLAVLDIIRKTAEAKALRDVQRRQEERLRNLGRPRWA